MKRGLLLITLLSLNLALAQTEVRIGYQRGNISSVLMQERFIEDALGDDVTVSWVLFPAGPPLLEAMNAGAIDFGLTGDSPPVFAQAGGVPLRYVAAQQTPTDEALIVPEGSEIASVEDLAGKQVGYTIGSSANYTLIKVLESAGLTLDDIESVPLQPADARAAFQGGNLDAWVIWDPFLTSATQELGAHKLISRYDVGEYRWFYLAAQAFTERHPDTLEVILEQLQVATDWIRDNPDGFAELLANETGIPTEVWSDILAARAFQDPEPITPELIESQQAVADAFFAAGSLPSEISVADAVWTWQPEQAAK